MANDTDIAWADVTVNPLPGCRKVSPGCANCYAERMARRLKAMGQPQYQDVVDANGWTGKVGCNLEAMKVPGKGKLVFCESMGDLFYEGTRDKGLLGIEDEAADRVFAAIAKQPQHTFQVLTKRPGAMRMYFAKKQQDMESHNPGGTWLFRDGRIHHQDHGRLGVFGFANDWPLRNLWLGVTAENQEWADKRIPILLQIPAAVPFVSFEPLLGPIDVRHGVPGWERCLACGRIHRMSGVGHARCDCMGFAGGRFGMQELFPLDSLDWVIVGCESGPKRRPCDNRWIEDIVKQCHAAGVPVFVKQISVKGKVIDDANQISNILGYPVEDIRQWPRKETDRAIPNKRL